MLQKRGTCNDRDNARSFVYIGPILLIYKDSSLAVYRKLALLLTSEHSSHVSSCHSRSSAGFLGRHRLTSCREHILLFIDSSHSHSLS